MRLQNKGRRQLAKTQQQRGLTSLGKVRAVLAVTFEEDRVSGEAVYARIEEGERRNGAKQELAVMNHAVRMAIGLGVEGFIDTRLIPGPIRFDGASAFQAREASDQYEKHEQARGYQAGTVACQHAPFFPRDQLDASHAGAPATKV